MHGDRTSPARASPTPTSPGPGGLGEGEVTITYAGHSTYLIDTPAGVRIATDFSGVYGGNPLPRVVTMNKAHRTHFTDFPDAGNRIRAARLEPGRRPGKHALVVDDVYIRNVPTDIRGGGELRQATAIRSSSSRSPASASAISAICTTGWRTRNYGAIGRLDVVMVPVDGGMTQSLDAMTEITDAAAFVDRAADAPPLDADRRIPRHDGRGLRRRVPRQPLADVSLRNLPDRPTIVVLEGV